MEGLHEREDMAPVALFWDQSLVWGLVFWETLQKLAIPFTLLTGKDIAEGRLVHHRVLVVPGGWASHKMKALGKQGREEIDRFILRGGSYLGFCGGAGLALSSPPSLSLVPLERMSLSERLPSASGGVLVQGDSDHPAWQGLPEQLPLSIWWPSQFSGALTASVSRLATYAAAGEDFMVADLPVSDLGLAAEDGGSTPWEALEAAYGINLKPERLMGHPAIIEATRGKGRLILSYPHMETPEDSWGHALLRNVLSYLDEKACDVLPPLPVPPPAPGNGSPSLPGRGSMESLMRARDASDDLIRFGERHLLWTWRRPWLLHWKRGIRGLEYGTLAVTLRALVELGGRAVTDAGAFDPWREEAGKIERNVLEFCRLAKGLLIEEKLAGLTGTVSKLGSVNKVVDGLRQQLFGSRMSHGGLSGELFNAVDALLLQVLRFPPGNIRMKH